MDNFTGSDKMKITKAQLKSLLNERIESRTLVYVSEIARFKDDIREAVALIVDRLAEEFPKLDAVNDRTYDGIVNGVANQTRRMSKILCSLRLTSMSWCSMKRWVMMSLRNFSKQKS